MNKSDLIKEMAGRSGLTKVQAGLALEAFCASVIDTLGGSDEITLVGFGTFSVVERAERMGRNPQTNEPLVIPATRVAKFKAGKALKKALKDAVSNA